MNTRILTALACGMLAMTGCAKIPGTWKMAPGQSQGEVSFSAMTLAADGTFTAEAKYGNETRVVSGFYTFCTTGCKCDDDCADDCEKPCNSGESAGSGKKPCCRKDCTDGDKGCCKGTAGCLCFESNGMKRMYKARLDGDTLCILHDGTCVQMHRLKR